MRNRSVGCRARSLSRVLAVAFGCFALGLVASPAFGQQESVEGKWVPPIGGLPDGVQEPVPAHYGWPLEAIDAALLSTGKVLVWENKAIDDLQNDPGPQLWNPVDGVFTAVPCNACVNPQLHCPGHSFLADGSLLTPGGRGVSPCSSATDDTRIFRLSANDWEAAADMAYSRFYPTCTTLSDGKILTVAGHDCAQQTVLTPEIYDPGPPGTWSEVGEPTTGIAQFYPFMFLLPDGKVFYAGGGA